MQFEFLRKKAASGESFVVLGSCSETILKEYDSLVSIFVTGNKDRKLKHVMEKFSLSKTAAAAKITKHDAYRRRYHNHYSDFKWGDSRNYDVCINSSRIGVEGTAKLLKKFVESVKNTSKGEHKPARNIIRVSEFPVSSRVMLPPVRAALRASLSPLFAEPCRTSCVTTRARALCTSLYHKRCCAAPRASLRAHARYKIKIDSETRKQACSF